MKTPRIMVSGMHRGENPQPGAGIVASIRSAFPDAFIVGLIYDALESGIYAEGSPDVVYAVPYPTSGSDAFLNRLKQITQASPADYFIPTLDSEIELLVHLKDEIRELGLKCILPETKSMKRRAKQHLAKLSQECRIFTPETLPVYDTGSAARAAKAMGYPVMIKGQYYGARKCENEHEVFYAVNSLLAEWGAPAILQKCIRGAEFNALGLGDGKGGVLGLCCIRKTILSDKGKGLGGITISDARLSEFCAAIISELKWNGPFEIEVIFDAEEECYALIEINPRFPAWVHFPTLCGINFPEALVRRLIDGDWPGPLPSCAPGHFYLRHQIEVRGHIAQIADIASSKENPTGFV